MPKSRPGGTKASPDNFRRTRPYEGRPADPGIASAAAKGSAASPVAASCPSVTASPPGAVLAADVPHEPADIDLLTDPGADRGQDVPGGLLALHIAEERLLHQAALLVEGGQLAIDDPGHDLVGFPFFPSLGLVDLPFLLHHVCRNILG